MLQGSVVQVEDKVHVVSRAGQWSEGGLAEGREMQEVPRGVGGSLEDAARTASNTIGCAC